MDALVFKLSLLIISCLIVCYAQSDRDASKPMRGYVEGDKGITDWMVVAQDELERFSSVERKTGKAKNVILFIGDGMGIPTVTAGRIYNAQTHNLMGLDAALEFEKFPHTALSKTYNTDRQVADSAGSGTAYHTGEKTKRAVIGLNQKVFRKDCANTQANKLRSVLKHCQDEGKWAGIVTSTRITHASPAGAYAHAADRDWESDAERNAGVLNRSIRDQCPDIASQLIDDEDNSKIRVLLGGGRRSLYPNTFRDPEFPEEMGKREDGRNLVDEWVRAKVNMGTRRDRVKYVYNQTAFEKVDPRNTDYLMGLFQPGHMNNHVDRSNRNLERDGEPSLAEMVEKAIKILRRSENGFYLFVEGGHIDLAHHETKSVKALNETVELSRAVKKAVDLTSEDDTLIVVSADHSHAFAMIGYPYISNDITGLVQNPEEGKGEETMKLALMDDGKPYSTLGYSQGPSYNYHRRVGGVKSGARAARKDLTYDRNIGTPDFLYDAPVERFEENHGGEDVAVYARGPMAHLLNGVIEQNYIAHVMMYAACVGPNKEQCNDGKENFRASRAERQPMRGYTKGDDGVADWNAIAADILEKNLKLKQSTKRAKNVILFIGDGMGPATVTSGRIYNAQTRNLMGDDAHLEFEKFPHMALSRTYNTDRQVADSAGSGTAYHTGEKTKRAVIGLNQKVFRKDCANTQANKLRSVLKHCQDKGKWAGIVSSARITHASPAGAYAHVADRDWESDAERNAGVPNRSIRDQCPDIASQLVDDYDNNKIRVLLGGGRRNFYPESYRDPEYRDQRGQRQDGRNLVNEWIKKKENMGVDSDRIKYVHKKSDFEDVDPRRTDYLMGLFQPGHMNYEADKNNPDREKDGEPTLAEMVEKAIEILKRSNEGFYLFVEAGHIDLAHHESKTTKALNETVALSDAVRVAKRLTDDDDTLIVVSADHSHAFTFSGYPYISNDILGLVKNPEEGKGEETIKLTMMDDEKPYLTLSYMNGPGYTYHRKNRGAWTPRKDLRYDDKIATIDYLYDGAYDRSEENHGVEDVAIYATGPWSHLFNGVHEQNYIAHAMMFASCTGPYEDVCELTSGAATSYICITFVATFLAFFSLLFSR